MAVAGGLDDVEALAVGGQQHGMVCLDDGGEVVRDALLWNDTRSAAAADDLVAELDGGAGAWAEAVGSVPLASFTVTKLRWLAEHEADNAARTGAVCLPHDWLTWRLAGARGIDALTTDRGDASGTGYWSPAEETYRRDLLELAFGADRPAAGRARPRGPGRHHGAGRACSAPAPVTTRRPRWASRPRRGDVVVSLGHVRRGVGGQRDPDCRCDRGGGRIRRCDRALPAARVHPQRGSGPGLDGPHARRHRSTSSPASHSRRRRGPAGL